MQNNKLTIPIAIVAAGLLIGGAIIYSKNPGVDSTKNAASVAQSGSNIQKVTNAKPVTSADHILGNPDAKVLVVEYSDTECPYCKAFDVTMGKVMDTYGKDGTVAWVYRQSPIAARHPLALKESEATECVNKIAGNEVFWKYLRKIYEITPGNNQLDPAQLPILAASFGVDKTAFQSCLDSGTFTAKIQADYNDSIAAGMQGTPYSVLIAKKTLSDAAIKQINDSFSSLASQYNTSPDQVGFVTTDKKVVLNGNLPFELVQKLIVAMSS